MHVDVAPLYPFSNQNGWLGVISIDELHVFCLVCGVVGAAIFFAVQWSVKSVKGNRSR
jgi:hypothetical protein